VLYCKKKKYMDNNNILALLERLTRNKNTDLHSSALKYRNGILIIFTHANINEKNIKINVRSLIEPIGINMSDYYIGVSNLHTSLSQLGIGINESIFAQKTGEVSNSSFNYFNDIGIYSILMPYVDEIWIHNFYNRIIMPIKNYDEKYNGELFNTAVKYIEKDGKINETANSLFLHKNTIRYRLGKIKELLNMEDYEGRFYEELSLAIKVYKINNI
jgi:sugar diacid utilization regulator